MTTTTLPQLQREKQTLKMLTCSIQYNLHLELIASVQQLDNNLTPILLCLKISL